MLYHIYRHSFPGMKRPYLVADPFYTSGGLGAYCEEDCGLKSTLVYPGHKTFILRQLLLERGFYGDGPNAFVDLRVSE